MKVNIDAGHGSNTAGKRTPPMPVVIDIDGDSKEDIRKGEQFKEHTANVGVASFLVSELERCGFKTMQTGFDDNNAMDDLDTALSARQRAIAKGNCDYSISVHFNAFDDGTSFNSAEGVGIYIHNQYIEQSEKLAKIVLKHLIGGSKQINRGITKQSLAMCNCNNLDVKAAILVELAFMTNQREATELMASKGFWKECSQEICKGICEYTGIKYIAENTASAKTITPNSSADDVNWLKSKINKVLKGNSYIPLELNGTYDNKTRIAVLILWESLGWNKDGADDGWRVGKKTIDKLV
jgi:N-acetylmuramoyl-L-alanine amidase